jgi:arylsulfatase A-like enzyme
LFGREFERFYLHRTERSKITRAIHWLHLTALLDNRKRANEVNREALAWIARGRMPFFAFLNYIDVHEAPSLQWTDARPRWGMATRIDQYDSAVSYVDAQLGELLQDLERSGILQNTIVIATSDHGEGLGEHDAEFHAISLYREQIHVPLLIRYPGHVPAGMRVSSPHSNTAVPGTILDLLPHGASNPFEASLISDISGTVRKDEDTQSISELAKTDINALDDGARRAGPTSLDGDMKSILTPRWHLIVHRTLGTQIYDWAKDPGELHNLINTPDGQAAARNLMPALDREGWP